MVSQFKLLNRPIFTKLRMNVILSEDTRTYIPNLADNNYT